MTNLIITEAFHKYFFGSDALDILSEHDFIIVFLNQINVNINYHYDNIVYIVFYLKSNL